MIAMDGIYAADEKGEPRFQVLLAPGNADIRQLAESLAQRIPAFLRRRGLGRDHDSEEYDPLARDEPGLAGIYGASVTGRATVSPSARRRTRRLGDQIDPENMEAMASPRCASVSGFNLHANTAIHADDRARLERLIQYCARPPVAIERLKPLPDGSLSYELKRPWSDGTTHVFFTPSSFWRSSLLWFPLPGRIWFVTPACWCRPRNGDPESSPKRRKSKRPPRNPVQSRPILLLLVH
jgi:hypothetical protein